MKILFILPSDNLYKYNGAISRNVNYGPMTFITLAALVPPDIKAEIEIIDEGVQKPDYEGKHYDIVGLTCVVSSAPRAYELSKYFREKGAYIIMGGAHPTSFPEEAKLHCDSLFLGFAEQTFPKFLRDFQEGKPEKLYVHDWDKPFSSPAPRRDLIPKKLYVSVPSVIANRGCMNNCEFCSIAQNFGNKNLTRPIGEVIDEIKGLKSKYILFLDPSPTSNREYALELFNALIPLKKKWAGLCTSDIHKDPELLDVIVRSGIMAFFVGFESLSQDSMSISGKSTNRVDHYKDCVKTLHSNGIDVMGAFVFGFDGDTKDGLIRVPELIDELRIDLPRIAILTPYPGTRIFERLKSQGRLLNEDWRNYDSQRVVFRPKNMTPEELQHIYYDVYKRTYSKRRIIRRSARSRHKIMISVFNGGFRKIVMDMEKYHPGD
jgi:radical SAM superfamily enzyme YgiQ (UPF0313 family)